MSKPKATIFISDLHLSSHQESLQNLFYDFLQGPALMAEKIYILGDLFDVWVGMDLHTDFYKKIARAFKALSSQGIQLFFMAGNRDFLLQNAFLKEANITKIDDHSIISLYGNNVLLSHGDKLCSQDIVYQRYRKVAQHPITKKLFLLLPKRSRTRIGNKLRQRSKHYQQQQVSSILDVCPESVEGLMKQAQVSYMLHGHVHRPKFHSHLLDNKPAMRFVLGDWHDTASFIISTPTNISLATFNKEQGIKEIESHTFDNTEALLSAD